MIRPPRQMKSEEFDWKHSRCAIAESLTLLQLMGGHTDEHLVNRLVSLSSVNSFILSIYLH